MHLCVPKLVPLATCSGSTVVPGDCGRHQIAVDNMAILYVAGAYFAGKGVEYVCVAGCAVQADKFAPRSSIERYAHSSYSQVCGDGHGHLGDCVVPLANAHLEVIQLSFNPLLPECLCFQMVTSRDREVTIGSWHDMA